MVAKKQINLLRGWPNPALLASSAIQTAAAKALSDPQVSTPGLLYGPDPGYQPLRESISRWLSDYYRNPSLGPAEASHNGTGGNGDEDDGDRICITGGASQNLACLLQVFTDPLYTRVWMVAPCYFLACRIFEDAGLRTRAVGEGAEGVDLEALEKGLEECEREANAEKKKVKLPKPWSKIYRHVIYAVPAFSNPSGRTMSLSCRRSLVQLARKYDALIITDDVYDFLHWPTSSPSAQHLTRAILPRLVDIDRTLEPVPGKEDFGNAVSNGTFSKIAGPGVRTGWAEATPRLIYGLSQCGSSRSGGAPSQLTATIINSLLQSGDLEEHIEKVLKPAFTRRYNLMMSAITRDLTPLGVKVEEGKVEGKDIFGGYFIWLELPEKVNAEIVSERCRERENLVVAPGDLFEVHGDESIKFQNSLRLCFAWEEEGDLEEGVKRLARVVKDVMEGKGGEIGGGRMKASKQDLGEFR